MEAAEPGELDALIELWLSAKEIDRLVARLDRASNTELEGLSHVAAKVFRAWCVRIVDAAKSKY
jgi:hypothetical protein